MEEDDGEEEDVNRTFTRTVVCAKVEYFVWRKRGDGKEDG